MRNTMPITAHPSSSTAHLISGQNRKETVQSESSPRKTEAHQHASQGVKSEGHKPGDTASVSDASSYSTAVSDAEGKTMVVSSPHRSSHSGSSHEPQPEGAKSTSDNNHRHQGQATSQIATAVEQDQSQVVNAGAHKAAGNTTAAEDSSITAQTTSGQNAPQPPQYQLVPANPAIHKAKGKAALSRTSSSMAKLTSDQSLPPLAQPDQGANHETVGEATLIDPPSGGQKSHPRVTKGRDGTIDEKAPGKIFNFNGSQGQFLSHKTKWAASSFFRKIGLRGREETNQEPVQTVQVESSTTQEQPHAVSIEDLTVGDVVIAVMGPTGSGKSTLIGSASGIGSQGIGHSLRSFTSEVTAVRFHDPESGLPVVLVDTPGFDDTSKPDLDILDMISEWLNSSYKQDKLLSGILYLHRITDNRMAGTPLKNLRVFQKLCGKDALGKVFLTTTMWDEVHPEVGEKRLGELKAEYWRGMLRQGAQIAQCRNDDDDESAKKLIRLIVGQESAARKVQLQQEMGDLHKELKETEAGQELYSNLERLVEKQMVLLRRISAERKAASDGSELAELQREYDELRVQVDDKLRQMQQLKLSLTKRAFRFLGSLGGNSE